MVDRKRAVAVDLGFIVDRSFGLKSESIQAQYNFINFLAIEFLLSLEWGHFGVILAAESAKTEIEFGDYYNLAEFQGAMKKLSTSAGGALRLDLALAAAYRQLFTTSAGMRSGKPRY